MGATQNRRHAGTVLAAAVVLCLVILCAVGALGYMTRTDVSTTANLVRELRATYLAEGIAAHIDARTNSRPWDQRFWMVEARSADPQFELSGKPAQLTFTKASGHLHVSFPELKPGDFDFAGVVKDVDTAMREYRIYVDVIVQGNQYAFSWDRRFVETLLGGLNRETSRLDKQIEDVTPNSLTADQLLEGIKAKAEAPAPDALQGQLQDFLTKLQSDQKAFETGKDVPVEPSGTPVPPPPPTLTPP